MCCHCRRRLFLHKDTVVTIATVAHDIGSQQWQWWGQATSVKKEAAVGAHNNQPTIGSVMATETASAAAAAAKVTAVAVAVARAPMASTATAQTAAAACEIYI